MDYLDSTNPIRRFLSQSFDEEFASIQSFKIDSDTPLPCLLVKTIGRQTIQLLVRAENDIEALQLCTDVGNYLKRNFADIEKINVFDIDFQTVPIPDVDEKTKKDEAWCYMRISYFES